MIINIELRYPRCDSNNLVRNGKKSNDPQNYLRNACKRQFIRDEERTCQDTLGCITGFIKTMLVRGCGACDVVVIHRNKRMESAQDACRRQTRAETEAQALRLPRGGRILDVRGAKKEPEMADLRMP